MSKMPLINFDERFADYTTAWMKEHESEYKTYDDLEADLPRIYMLFLNTRAPWLGSITPGSYFTQFEDPKVLVDWLSQYCEEQIPVPDLLLEQINFVGKPCEKRLLKLLEDPEAPEEARMIAVGLLRDLKSTQPKMLYIRWQLDRAEKDDLKDNALESLQEMGETVVQPILQEISHANPAGQEALMDVLARFPGNEQVFRLALKLFNERPQKRALFAGYLARLGDDRALPDLLAAAREESLSYLTFIEIRNAIEELGGVCPERVFDDDPEYEALRGMDLT